MTLSNGSALDRKESYTVAVSNYMAGAMGYTEGNGDGYKMLNWYDKATPKGSVSLIKETGWTYRGVLRIYFENHQDAAAGASWKGALRIWRSSDVKSKRRGGLH